MQNCKYVIAIATQHLHCNVCTGVTYMYGIMYCRKHVSFKSSKREHPLLSWINEGTMISGYPTLPAPVMDIMTVTCYREQFKIHKKLAIHNSHLCFLNICLRKRFIPQSLKYQDCSYWENEGPGEFIGNESIHIISCTGILLMKLSKKHHRDLVSTLYLPLKVLKGTSKKRRLCKE